MRWAATKYFCWLMGWLIVAGQSQAETVTNCGASEGVAYFFESPLVSRDDAGWKKDTLSKGAIQLVRDGEVEFDIIYKDVFGTKSARAAGFTVARVPGTGSTRYVIVGANPATGVLEHYVFNLDAAGYGSVAWGTVRGGSAFPKSSLMAAQCTGPR